MRGAAQEGDLTLYTFYDFLIFELITVKKWYKSAVHFCLFPYLETSTIEDLNMTAIICYATTKWRLNQNSPVILKIIYI
jgi:hypothetical protein